MSNAADRLDGTWASLPEWVKEAFHQCPIVQRTILNCAANGMTHKDMLWELARVLYEDRNRLRAKLIESAKLARPVYVIKTTE